MYNGVINIYKEKGYTSFDVVARLRGMLKQKKIGHTGTLDPDATGVLPVCLGKGTKLCDMLLDKDKTYKAVLIFGISTDTEDISGKIINEENEEDIRKKISDEDIVNTINSFLGIYEQLPPMYSAIKINGKKLYELAREGKTVERKKRTVEIKEINIKKIEFPRVFFEVTCSKGTYIRSLCRDIGDRLDTSACMEALERTKVGRFHISESITLDKLQELADSCELEKYILSIDEALEGYSKVTVKNQFSKLLYNGNPIGIEMINEKADFTNNEWVRVYDYENTFIGIFEFNAEKKILKNVKMFYEN
ncbi:MAG: tRNA pseudouridine(55) synthase TruB [Lachnospiraceae bacterium]|nr:tRNA pseudouridine(55) synthase TruB [Lachnospiraceae bacterium]